MMWFPERPIFSPGILCIPEKLDLPEENNDSEEVDRFVELLIESMKRNLRGGSHG